MQRLQIPRRDRSIVVTARPAPGDHRQQVDAAFARMMDRYGRALRDLADK